MATLRRLRKRSNQATRIGASRPRWVPVGYYCNRPALMRELLGPGVMGHHIGFRVVVDDYRP